MDSKARLKLLRYHNLRSQLYDMKYQLAYLRVQESLYNRAGIQNSILSTACSIKKNDSYQTALICKLINFHTVNVISGMWLKQPVDLKP